MDRTCCFYCEMGGGNWRNWAWVYPVEVFTVLLNCGECLWVRILIKNMINTFISYFFTKSRLIFFLKIDLNVLILHSYQEIVCKINQIAIKQKVNETKIKPLKDKIVHRNRRPKNYINIFSHWMLCILTAKPII